MQKVLLFFTTLLLSVHLISATTKCAHFIGKVYCSDKSKIVNTVVQLWDKDCDWEPLRRFNDDDLASTHIFTMEDEEHFSVTGCASDSNILWIQNHPEFFLRIKHNCRGRYEEQDFYPTNSQKFLPSTNEYFDLNPIYLG